MEPNKLIEIMKSVFNEEMEKFITKMVDLNNDEYLTRKQAAAFLHISETTLWKLDVSQELPARRLNGKVLYLKSDLLNFSKQ